MKVLLNAQEWAQYQNEKEYMERTYERLKSAGDPRASTYLYQAGAHTTPLRYGLSVLKNSTAIARDMVIEQEKP